MAKRKSKYPGTEAALYLIVEIVCGLCLKRLKDFSAFKKKYTEECVNSILQSLTAAEAMPNYESRQAQQGNKGTALKKANTSVCSLFQKLLLYLEDGFDQSEWADMQKAAGADFYNSASKRNWKDSKTMQAMAIEFMSDYATELANGGMPDGFATDFTTQNTAFLAALVSFTSGKSTTGEETYDKTNANNDLYTRLQALMKDGKRIFEGNPALQEQFSYQAQLVKVGGMGDTGFRFSLREEGTLLPVPTATVSFLPSGSIFSIENEETGVILAYLPELKKDEVYNYMLTAPGYEEMVGTLVANTGVMHRVDLILKKEVMSIEPPADAKKIG